MLERKHRSEDLRALNSLVVLVTLLSRDILKEGASIPIIKEAFLGSTEEVRRHYENRIRSSGGAVKDWFKPIIDMVKEGVGAAGNLDGLSGAATTLSVMIRLWLKALEELGSEDLVEHINEFADLLENNLGLTKDRLLQPVEQTIDRIIEDLTKDYLGGVQTAETRNNFLIGNHLATLKEYVLRRYAELDLLSFDRRRLVRKLVEELRSRGWDDWMKKLADGLNQLDGMSRDVSASFGPGNGSGGDVAAAPGPSARSMAPAENIRVSAYSPSIPSGEQISWYATWFYFSRFGNQNVQVDKRLEINKDTFDREISFKEISGAGMEHWAHFSSALSDLLEAGLHAGSIEKGDFVSNLVNLSLQSLKGVMTLAAYDHKGSGWSTYFSLFDNYFFEHFLSSLGTILGSLEQHPGAKDAWALSNLFPDLGEMFLYSIWTNSLREFMLSLLTLINADPEGQPDSRNHERVEGFVMGWIELAAWGAAFLPFIFRGRKHYGAPAHNPSNAWYIVLYWVVGGFGMGYLMAWAGWAVGGAIAGKQADNYWGDNWWKVLILSFIKWPLYWFLMWDGKTNDGRFGLDAEKKGTDEEVVEYPGYPHPENSPYKLPYPKGKLHQCVQGNYGVWSHNPDTWQVYAFDFNHNEGDAVSAMRGGTVVAFNDEITDNSTEDWNGVTIVHNDSREGALPDPEHDRDHRGVIPTSGQYGHGQHFGVRYAFASRGIPYPYIWGSRVKQGDLIMYAGDTGMSAYNHLHIHILPQTVMGEEITTIPFVFKEVKKKKVLGFIPIGRDGLPAAFNYYDSENEPGRWGAGLSLYHPAFHSSTVKQQMWPKSLDDKNLVDRREIYNVGADSAMLTYRTAQNDVYNGYFILVGSELQLIRDYEFNETTREGRVLLANNWGTIPSNYSDFQIVSRIRESGPNYVVLDPAANANDDAYKNAHIFIKYKTTRGGEEIEVFEYKKIIAYQGDSKRATIQGAWDQEQAPPPGSEFEIGGLPYATTRPFFKRFAFLQQRNASGEALPLEEGRAVERYRQIGKYHEPGHAGNIGANAALGGNILQLAADASDQEDVYAGRHVVIKQGSDLVQYKKITAYRAAAKEIVIDGVWELDLTTARHDYEIGAAAYAQSDATDKKKAFLCPDDPAGEHAPANFDHGAEDQREPYRYLTFNSAWPAFT